MIMKEECSAVLADGHEESASNVYVSKLLDRKAQQRKAYDFVEVT